MTDEGMLTQREVEHEAHERHHAYGEIPTCLWCLEEMGPGAARTIMNAPPAELQLAEMRKRMAAMAVEYRRESRWIRSDAVAELLEEWLSIQP